MRVRTSIVAGLGSSTTHHRLRRRMRGEEIAMWRISAVLIVLLALAMSAGALSPGTDILVPAAARTGSWVTDLYILNSGDRFTTVSLYWLVRDQANTGSYSKVFTISPREALALGDVVRTTFGIEDGVGAIRVVADYPVVANARIYNQQDGVTFGQGFEGVPRDAAVSAGDATDIVGLVNTDRFRTNLAVIDASASGSWVTITLYDAAGVQIATRGLALGRFEPKLKSISSLFSELPSFDYATLHAEVVTGAAIFVASSVDNGTGDPATLESWTRAYGTSTSDVTMDGRYQVVLYDSYEYGTGGYLTIEGELVTSLQMSYMNWDKGDPENPDCTRLFLMGGPGLEAYTLDDYLSGVTFRQSFTGSGTLTFKIAFDVTSNILIWGSVEATGTGFSGVEQRCNGAFPPLLLRGGKTPSPQEPGGPGGCRLESQCCKVCVDSKACGDSCIPLSYTCHQPPGCACNDWEVCPKTRPGPGFDGRLEPALSGM